MAPPVEVTKALKRYNLPISKIVVFTCPGNAPSAKVRAALDVDYVDNRVRSAKDGICAYYEITREQAAERPQLRAQ